MTIRRSALTCALLWLMQPLRWEWSFEGRTPARTSRQRAARRQLWRGATILPMSRFRVRLCWAENSSARASSKLMNESRTTRSVRQLNLKANSRCAERCGYPAVFAVLSTSRTELAHARTRFVLSGPFFPKLRALRKLGMFSTSKSKDWGAPLGRRVEVSRSTNRLASTSSRVHLTNIGSLLRPQRSLILPFLLAA
jgi:hypothetical protein